MLPGATKEALKDLTKVKPYVPANPTTIRIQLSPVDKMSDFIGRAGVELQESPSGNFAISRGDTWLQAWDQVWHW